MTTAFLFFGYVLTAVGLRDAPEGFETERGFDIVWQNNAPGIRNVACIWATLAETAGEADVDSISVAA